MHFFELQPLWSKFWKGKLVFEWHAALCWDPTSSLGTKGKLPFCSYVSHQLGFSRVRVSSPKGCLALQLCILGAGLEGRSSGTGPAEPGGKKRFYLTFFSSLRQDPRNTRLLCKCSHCTETSMQKHEHTHKKVISVPGPCIPEENTGKYSLLWQFQVILFSLAGYKGDI